jgi:hypothetical protein
MVAACRHDSSPGGGSIQGQSGGSSSVDPDVSTSGVVQRLLSWLSGAFSWLTDLVRQW